MTKAGSKMKYYREYMAKEIMYFMKDYFFRYIRE